MLDWVRALLDASEIVQSPGNAKKQITPPPKFDLPPLESLTELAPPRSRSRRSASPAKLSSPKKTTSPRKSRVPRATKESSAAASTAASASLQSALDTAASVADSESVDGTVETNGVVPEEKETKTKKGSTRAKKQTSAPVADEKVRVNVESTTDVKDEIETTQTNVSVEMPVSLPDLPPAADTEQMIAQAKQMVEEATKLQEAEAEAESSASPKANKKRKSDEVEDEEGAEPSAQPTKKARVLEDKLRRERVRNRALVGVTATLALA